MRSRTLWIRADVTSRTGAGHVMRCIALGEAWKRRGGEVVFCSRCESRRIAERIQAEGFGLFRLEGPEVEGNSPAEPLKALWRSGGQHSAWVALDGYSFGPEYQRAVKEIGKKLLVIDDYNHFPWYGADLLLNQNVGAEHFRYEASKGCRFLLGPRYALLREEFLQAKASKPIRAVGERILVTMGGSDPERVTLKIIEGLSGLDLPRSEVKIVVGPANAHGTQVKSRAAGSNGKWDVLEAGNEMPLLMAWADLAVTAGGGTCMELAFMGVPFLVMAIAENQKQVMSGFSNIGAAAALGWHAVLEPKGIGTEIEALAKDSSRRENFSRLGQALVDGLGARRVTEVMDPTEISLRPVREQDCEILWRWANEPGTRKASFSSDSIPWEDHRRWFDEKLHSGESLLYMATNQHGVPLGQARFDFEWSNPVISVSLDQDFRSLGLGTRLIRAASEQAMRERNPERIDAWIKTENPASLKAFAGAGYKNEGEETVRGCAAVRLSFRKDQGE